jgi:peptide/nickel transport system substrate-binding protein
VKGSHLVMDRFDKYFEPGLPYLDRVVIRVIKDPVTQMAAFKASEIDFIADFSVEHVDTLRAQNPTAQIMTGKETTPMVAQMKITIPRDGKPMSKDRAPHPIFSDVRVRKAVGCYGIDRQEIVKIAFKGQATRGWVWSRRGRWTRSTATPCARTIRRERRRYWPKPAMARRSC